MEARMMSRGSQDDGGEMALENEDGLSKSRAVIVGKSNAGKKQYLITFSRVEYVVTRCAHNAEQRIQTPSPLPIK